MTESPDIKAVIFEREDGAWGFHFQYPNGEIAGHEYNSKEGAADGLYTLLSAIIGLIEMNVPTEWVERGDDG